jgi:hypothetical protein
MGNIFEEVFEFFKEEVWEPVFDFVFGSLVPDIDENIGRGTTITKRGSLEHIPVIYGQRRTGGIVNFKGAEGGVTNEYLWIEFILAEGECEDIVMMYLDGVEYTDSKFSGLVTLTKYLGTDAQTYDTNLQSKFSDYDTTDHGKGLCKAVVSLKYDQENMTREPRFEFLVKGKKLYDTRTTTTAYADNPALALYDYLTNSRYGSGYKISSSDLVAADFNSAANYCETQIEIYSGAGTNTDYYQINAVVDTKKKVRENILELLSSFNAHLVPEGDKYRLIVEKDESSVLSLDSDNIIESSITYAINDVRNRYNEIIVSYPNEENNYLDDQYIYQDATLLSADNNIESQSRTRNYYDVNQYRIGHYAKIVLKKSRQGIAVGLTANEEAFEVLPGAIVDLTLSEPGWSAKKFRVLSCKELKGGNVALKLLEHESTVYDRTVPVAAPTPPDTYLPDPFSVAQVTGLSAASGITHVITNSSGDLVARIFLQWTALNDVFVTQYEIRARVNGATDWIYQTPAIGQTTNKQYVIGFDDGDLVDLQVRAVNSRGVFGAWSTTLQHTVEGVTGNPPDVDTFTVFADPDGTRVATFDITTPPIDLAGYKIRYSSNQAEVWANMDALHEGLLTQSPFEFNLLSDGAYRFAIKAFDRGGRESDNAVYVIADLPARRLGTILRTDNPRGQGWPGTLTNCRIEESDNSLVGDTNTTWSTATGTWDSYNESWFFDTVDSFVYQFSTIDLGVSLSASVDVQSLTSYGSTTLSEVRYSDDDISYSSWEDVSTAGLLTARYFQIRITVTNTGSIPKLDNMNIYLGGDSIVDYFRLLDTSGLSVVGGGGVRIPIRSNFQQITDVNVSLQSVGSGATWEFIDLDATNGPHIKMYNGSGTLIYPIISAQVIGV